MCCLPRTEPAIAIQVKRDPLEEMAKVVDPKTATLEHLQLIVEAFDKATVLPVAKVVGDQVQPGIQELEEAVEAS
jgi:hypothetical protein